MAAKKTFEENMSRLEEIVSLLERGDATLGDSMALFEEGTKLVNACRKELDTAEQKVVKLSKVSFVCAMQVQTFRKVRGHAYASTMCIGNMRSGTEALCAYFHTGDKEILHKALTYFGVVLLFALGAGVGSIATLHWGAGTIWLSCGLLTVSFLIMFIHDEEQKFGE
mgnify:CR=1 FL=1